MKVVWKLLQFKKIIVSEPGLRFLPFETFSESGGGSTLLISIFRIKRVNDHSRNKISKMANVTRSISKVREAVRSNLIKVRMEGSRKPK